MTMRSNNTFLKVTFALVALASCNNDGYIDPISKVDPGPDQTAPTVTIGNPNLSKIIIPFTQTSTDMNFQFEVKDDIEIKTVVVRLNGQQLQSFDNFLDYRRSNTTIPYNDLPVGTYKLEVTATDVSGKSTTQSFDFQISNIYEAKYTGEIFYMPFEAESFVDLISKTNATVVGTPGFADGKIGKAYAGTEGSYLTFPTAAFENEEFSAVFWYNVNASPDRAGILTIGPPDPNMPATPNNRTSGFRLFREGSATNQIFKLNVGNGTGDNWFDGGAAASRNPATTDWSHIAFTISGDHVTVYIDGEVVSEGDFPGIDWTNTDILSIGSGAPRFTEWGHLSDRSLIDELRIFNKALSQEEVQTIMEEE
jgi:hypothetical protein